MCQCLLHNGEDWAGSVGISPGRENLELGTKRSFRGGKHWPWAGRVPDFCPWQNPWGKKRRSGARPGGGRGCCGSGLAVPLTPVASHGHPEAGEWAARERPQGVSAACAGPPALAPLQSGPACPPAARCMWRSLCTRLPPPLTRPVSPALPLAPASRFRPVSLRLLSEGGVAQDSRRRVIFPGGLRRGLKGYPLVAVQQPSWEPLILWKERAGRGRKGGPCLVCCSAPCPAL